MHVTTIVAVSVSSVKIPEKFNRLHLNNENVIQDVTIIMISGVEAPPELEITLSLLVVKKDMII